MRTDDILQVIPAAAESANMLTGSATVEFATTVPEHAAHGAAATAAGGLTRLQCGRRAWQQAQV